MMIILEVSWTRGGNVIILFPSDWHETSYKKIEGIYNIIIGSCGGILILVYGSHNLPT
jgi:hypothetical protein